VLLAARGFSVVYPDDRRDVDLVVSHADRRMLVTVVNDEGQVLAQRLKRVADRPPSGPEERILVRSAGLPIPRTARKSWALWSLLAASRDVTPAGLPRVRVLAPTLPALASLEAVRCLMSESRAGDLESHGETVVPEVVTAWIRGHLHDEELDRLVAEIVAGSPAAAGPMHRRVRDTMLEILQRRHVMTIEDLAVEAGCRRSEAEAVLAADATSFGTIGSPPALAFERTTSSA